jgi:hypothetical protein
MFSFYRLRMPWEILTEFPPPSAAGGFFLGQKEFCWLE